MTVLARLTDHVCRISFREIPHTVKVEAVRATLNWMGCAIGGSRRDAPSAALRAAERLGSSGKASVFCHGQCLDAAGAAFVNCISASVDAFDDTHPVMMLHATSPVACGAFAVAEITGASGADLLAAIIVGMEVETRLCEALAMPPAVPRRAVYLTGLTAPAGTAAAVSRLLGLDKERTGWAMSLAATTAAGFQEALSSMACPFIPSHASRNGVAAAFLAAEGFNGSDTVFEGPRGFGKVFAEEPRLDAVTDGFGEDWRLTAITYKPYPCGIVIHPALDACLALHAEHRFAAADVAAVEARVNPLVITLTGRQPTPADTLQAQVSAHHWIAVTLAGGSAGIEAIDPSALGDPVIAALRRRITLTADELISRDAVELDVRLADGRVLSKRIEHCRGSETVPMTDAELAAKFRAYAGRVLSERTVEALIETMWNIDRAGSVADVGRLARG